MGRETLWLLAAIAMGCSDRTPRAAMWDPALPGEGENDAGTAAPVTPPDHSVVEAGPDASPRDGSAGLADAAAPLAPDAGAAPGAEPDAGSDAERVVCPHGVIERAGVARFPCDITVGSRFQVPDAWRTIVFDANVTVTGSLFVPRDRTGDLTIRGRDRHTSRLRGTGQFASGHDAADRERSAVFSESPHRVFVRDLTSLDPDKFHLVSYGGALGAERVDLITTTGTATTDGFGGGDGSFLRDSYIDTFDDAVKVYARDIVVERVTIRHRRNGAPIQLGWSGQDQGTATITDLTVIDASPRIYNMALISWAGKSYGAQSVRDLTLHGLTRRTEPGAAPSPTYQFGSGGGAVHAATIRVNGYCEGRVDVIQRNGSDGVVSVASDCP